MISGVMYVPSKSLIALLPNSIQTGLTDIPLTVNGEAVAKSGATRLVGDNCKWSEHWQILRFDFGRYSDYRPKEVSKSLRVSASAGFANFSSLLRPCRETAS